MQASHYYFRLVSAVTALSLSSLTVIGCGDDVTVVPEHAKELVRKPVIVAEAQRGSISDTLTLIAELKPFEETQLSAGPQGGLVESVLIKDGSLVKRGQLLARISSGVAQANLKQAHAVHATAKANHGRVSRLAEKKMASAANLEQANASLATAEAAVAMAKIAYAGAFITAPHSGVVVHLEISKGEMASPGKKSITVVDISKIKAVAQLPERDVPFVELGRDAIITLDALPDLSLPGKVGRIGVLAAKYSRTFDLEVHVDNSAGTMKPGMLARVQLRRQHLEDVIVTRRDAIIEGIIDGVPARYVFVENNGLALRRQVTVGPSEGVRTAVLKGIEVGDRVITVGQRSLVDKQPVLITSGATKTKANVAKATAVDEEAGTATP